MAVDYNKIQKVMKKNRLKLNYEIYDPNYTAELQSKH